MVDKNTQSSSSNDIVTVTEKSSSSKIGGGDVVKELTISESTVKYWAGESSQYDNDGIKQATELNAFRAREVQDLKDRVQTQQKEVQRLKENVLRQQQANARALNSNKDLGFVTGGLVAVLISFYSLVTALATFKHRESFSNGHHGVLASLVLVVMGATIAVFIAYRVAFSQTNILRTITMKFCVWFLAGATICAPVLLGVECFGLLSARVTSWILMPVIWVVVGYLFYKA